MLWTLLLILLLAAIAAVLWMRRQQEREWLRELTYLSRHETQPAFSPEDMAAKPPKALRGVDPNLQNTRQSHKAAEEARAVYDKTVAKLRELSPKHSRKLDATSGKNTLQPNDNLDDLPIFAAPTQDASAELPADIDEVADEAPIRALKAEPLRIGQAEPAAPDGVPPGHDIPMFGAVIAPTAPAAKPRPSSGKAIAPAPYLQFDESEYRSAKAVDAELPVITLEEATRALYETPLADLAQPQNTPAHQAELQTHAPAPDLEVVDVNWQFKPALEAAGVQAPKPPVELKTISLDDPALIRTRARTLAEVQKISHQTPKTELAESVRQAMGAPETIGEEDIRANLLRQRMARRRQVSAQEPLQTAQPNVIPEGEILANLAKTDSPVNRRIRRVNTTVRESVIPEAARVEQSHAIKLQVPKAAAPISTRFTPYAAMAATAAPTATVVEPPPMPEVDMMPLDIPEPPVFNGSAYDERYDAFDAYQPPEPAANAHISDAPRWSITDRLISESAPIEPAISIQTASEEAVWLQNGQSGAMPSEAAFEQSANLVMPSESMTPPRIIEQGAGTHLPSLGLLLPPQFDPSATQTEDALLENSITIEEKLAEFKVKVKVMDAYAGPVITRYEIEPDVGVRGNAVLNLEKDLARSLGVASIRVVETIPGKTCMGLELPNPKRQMIRLSEIFDAPVFQDSKSKLTVALGKDIAGVPVVGDLAKMPHLLVAGMTGSGKSVGVNGMIMSMLFKATPEEVRFIMIDPKMLELSIYDGIPHLLCPVVTDMREAGQALNWCVAEMEKRYRLLSHMGVRNIEGFNQKVKQAKAAGKPLLNPFSLNPDAPEPLETLPMIVLVIDELADLMMTERKSVEQQIARLAQKARAAGIHMIVATQRPSVDVVTGLIKANIPTRMAFTVQSKIDSRTILDQMGADSAICVSAITAPHA
jgi:S-DNA-T family DNA segregation ATPase FtsK/SpoIIIE